MARKGGNPLCIGNKNSGNRRSPISLLKAKVVKFSWDRIFNKFQKKNLSVEQQKKLDDIAIEIVKRTIPQEISGNVDGSFEIKVMNYGESDMIKK